MYRHKLFMFYDILNPKSGTAVGDCELLVKVLKKHK